MEFDNEHDKRRVAGLVSVLWSNLLRVLYGRTLESFGVLWPCEHSDIDFGQMWPEINKHDV